MKTIYLIRHCEYSNPRNILVGRLPVVLSERGKQHAQRLAKYFLDKKIDLIWSSKVKRCEQTSKIISAGKINIEFDKRILETFSAYQGFWQKTKELNWSHSFGHQSELGGETFPDIQKRIIAFWQDLLVRSEKNIIICSHGDPLYVLGSYLANQKLPDDPNLKDKEYPAKGSIRKVVVDGGVKIFPLVEV